MDNDELSGPCGTNLITACALVRINLLAVLLIPGDVLVNRRPDPGLQWVEDFNDRTVSANDGFSSVSRFFDRITRPVQTMPALERPLQVLTDSVEYLPHAPLPPGRAGESL